MSTVHIHLLLNHVPVIGAVIGLALLGVAILRRSDELARVTFWLYALLGAASVVVYLTGEPAEEAVENLAGVSKALIEQHEESALVATIAMGAAGALALLATFVFRRKAIPRPVVGGGFVMALLITGLMGYTANLGGQIRHTEISAGAVPSVETSRARSGVEKDED
ncbi:MAG TPA: hypothetical protein VKA54_01305 [Gemmatimonadaceae bacterium]|nr:hypothetical protein [Gemmatimonadaceae bacterium]